MLQTLMNASPFHARMAATVLMGSPVIRATAFPVIPVLTAKQVGFFFLFIRLPYRHVCFRC